MKMILWVLVCVTVVSGFAAAQKKSDEYNKVEIFAGYSGAAALNPDDTLSSVENGFDVAAVYNFHRYFGVKADLTGTFATVTGTYFTPSGAPSSPASRYRAGHSLYNATVGIQVKDNRRDTVLKPFGHVLVGVAKHQDNFSTTCPGGAVCPPFNSDFTGFSFIIGGGLDFKVNHLIDIRAIQLDINPISADTGGQRNGSYNNFRFSSGVIFKF